MLMHMYWSLEYVFGILQNREILYGNQMIVILIQ